jgi:predicted DNA-binding antitoxin AbrB/MazE fold protein
MTQILEVMYRDGQLHPIKPISLTQSQTLHIMLLTEREAVEKALGDLLVKSSLPLIRDLMREIEAAIRGQRPLSEDIIEERWNGP